MRDKNWIEKAVKHPGALKAKASRSGESTKAFASEHAGSPGTLGKQARLAETLMSMHTAGRAATDGEKASITAAHHQMGGENY
jgi:hypothetical protein